MKIVLFGATGYQGALAAEAMVRRGLRPLLAGRNLQWLRALSTELGDLPYEIADLEQPESLRALLCTDDVLVTTVGPFFKRGPAQLEAALSAGAHYVDSCGEGAYYREIHQRYAAAARDAGKAVLTACAYDFFPGNVVADHVLHRAGPEAVRVDIGYFGDTAPGYQLSAGSLASGTFTLLEKGLFFREGRYVEEPMGTRLGYFELEGRPVPGLSIPGTEHLFLPALHPQLRDINSYWGWGRERTHALHQVFRATATIARQRTAKRLLNKLLSRLSTSDGSGPHRNLRDRSSAYVSATAFDDRGNKLASAQMGDADGFNFTAEILAWSAEALLRGELLQPGAVGPVQAFGRARAVQGHAEAGFELQEA